MKIIKTNKHTNRSLSESIDKEIESQGKKLQEKAEMKIKGIHPIELNEVMASLKEYLDEKSDDFKYFRLVLDGDENKAYIDVESKDMSELPEQDIPEPLRDFGVDDILSIYDPADYNISAFEFDGLKEDILAEKDLIEKKIIPQIAKQWGFRNIKESINEGRKGETPSVEDMLFANLCRDDKYYVLKDIPKTKYYDGVDKDGNDLIVTKDHYDFSQTEQDWNGSYQIIYISLIDKEDAKTAQFIADTLGLESEFDTRKRPKDGYNYVYKIYLPTYVEDKDAADFLVQNGIPHTLFRLSDRVRSATEQSIKRAEKAKKTK